MNIQTYSIVHYGKDYLPYAIRSVYSQVDRINIFYTRTPSHGHSTDISPIETRQEIHQAAFSYDPSNKIHFFEVSGIKHEGPQRDYALAKCKEFGADIVLVQDYDEVWNKNTLAKTFKYINSFEAYRWRVNFVHFWRSFNYVCRDDGWPDRIIDLRQQHNKDSIDYIPKVFGDIYHFGYCVSDKVMRYKWRIHGHKNELRPEWFSDRWDYFALNDVHPTNKNFWNAERFNKRWLPYFMRVHPYYDLEMVENLESEEEE